MTPEARVAAAIDVLDQVVAGSPAEKTLTTWARKNRYAGSKDRAAVRDLVFDALRQRRSSAYLGGSDSGRGLMIGQIRLKGLDPAETFSGKGYGPSPLSEQEASHSATMAAASDPIRLDCPDWLWSHFQSDLSGDAQAIFTELRERAPVFVRSNQAKGSREEALRSLSQDEIIGQPHALSDTAIEVTQNARRIRHSVAYQSGLVELQDAASQAVVDLFCQTVPNGEVLDFCAGGGGKSLAMAAKGLRVLAHDSDPGRMADIPERARRAGVSIKTTQTPTGLFDAVLCDAPCSGCGAWRRQPEAKWRLTPEALDALNATQDQILDDAKRFVREGGFLAYATCSMLSRENDARIDYFLSQTKGWTLHQRRQLTPLEGGDGFFIAILIRN